MEHAFAELKQYKRTSSVWRHPRPLLSQLVTICALLVCRKKLDGWQVSKIVDSDFVEWV